jgi:hypothetical protein
MDTINKALSTAKAKLDELVEARKKIDREIVDWKKVLDSLSVVSGEVNEELPPDIDIAGVSSALKLSFTDGIRTVLQITPGPMTAPQIRDRLITNYGFDFSKYRQELVPVHNTLKRLEEQGEVETIRREGQGVSYRWITPIERALKDVPTPGSTVPLASLMGGFPSVGQKVMRGHRARMAEQAKGQK